MLFLLGAVVVTLTAASIKGITLAWDPNSEPDIAGYVMYSGTNSGAYDTSTFVGNVTSYTPTNLVEGVDYFFAVTAINASGLESDFSNEISVKLPGTGEGGLTFSITTALVPNGLRLSWPSGPRAVFRVLYKTNLSDSVWNELSSDVVATNEVTSWTDTTFGQSPSRFYRVVQNAISANFVIENARMAAGGGL